MAAKTSDRPRTISELLPECNAPGSRYYGLTWTIAQLTDGPALDLWNTVPAAAWQVHGDWDLQKILARFELRALPGLLAIAPRNLQRAVATLAPVGSTRVAPLMAEALLRLKKVRPIAEAWLQKFPREAALSLIPAAVGDAGKPREAAEVSLRHLAASGHGDTVLATAREYGADALEAVGALLSDEKSPQVPARERKPPAFWRPETLPPPLLRDRTKPLALSDVKRLGATLMQSTIEHPHPDLEKVREACDPGSLAQFAWALFEAWHRARMPANEEWAFDALAHLGDDEVAGKLAPLVREWPGWGHIHRATRGLEVLARIGTDGALMRLYGIAQKAKSRPLQERAGTTIQRVADARGLTTEELADRLVPDLELDPDGSRTLDYGARTFRVGFDEQLRPFVMSADGTRLKDLPKPTQSDHRTKSTAAQKLWKDLKAEARTFGREQITRLERAMCWRRRWSTSTFRTLFLEHPLLRHLVKRLVWAIYDEQDRVVSTFRVDEDGSLAGIDDQAFSLPADARIGIAHRLDLLEQDVDRWSASFGDYEILQPFLQLGRTVYRRTAADAAQPFFGQVEGLTVPTARVLILQARGWRRGPIAYGRFIVTMIKPLPLRNAEATLALAPGLSSGDAPEGDQTLGRVTLTRDGEAGQPLTAGELDEISYSELLSDLAALRG